MGAVARHETLRTRARLLRGWRSLGWWLACVAIAAGVANLIVLLAQGHALIRGLALNADNSSTFSVPALAGEAPAGAVINLGNHPWYEPWWFMRLTAGLPGYRLLWEIAPFVWYLLGVAVVAAGVWWVLGRVQALICAVVLLATSEAMRAVVYVPESHVLIVFHTGVLCATLVFVYRRSVERRLAWRTLLALAVPLVLITGAGLTDQLLIPSGLAPFVLAPLLCLLRFRTRAWMVLSAFALLTGALSALLALLLAHVMQEEHVVHTLFPIAFVSIETVFSYTENLIGAMASLGGGSFFALSVSGADLFTFAVGVLIFGALVAVLRALWRRATAISLAGEALTAQQGSREVFVAFWGSVLVLGLASFLLTTLGNNPINYRYLVGVWVALAALLGLLCTTTVTRNLMLVAVAAFAGLTVRAEIEEGVGSLGVGPSPALVSRIALVARDFGASTGYTGYWDAAPMTWESHLRIKAYPVQACGSRSGLCPFDGIQISSWYTPRPHTNTFLVTDGRPGIGGAVVAPPGGLGVPIAHEWVGGGFTVYIYNHDIAAQFGK